MVPNLSPKFSGAKLRMVRRILKRLKIEYKKFLCTSTRSIDHRVFQYINGIFLERGRGNMSKYAQVVPGSSKQSLQHMISKSHWRDDLILNQIQKDVTKLCRKVLIFDSSVCTVCKQCNGPAVVC